MGVDLAALMDADKRLTLVPNWSPINEELSFLMPLEIDGATVALNLRGRTALRQPDRNVMFQVEFQPAIGKAEPLCRLDWLPPGPHNNRNRGPAEHRFIQMHGSHVHEFALNWVPETQKMLGKNLPIAMPLANEPSFQGLLAVMGQSFKILNATGIPVPPWEKGLI